jgi:hypothetical protein
LEKITKNMIANPGVGRAVWGWTPSVDQTYSDLEVVVVIT